MDRGGTNDNYLNKLDEKLEDVVSQVTSQNNHKINT